MKILFCDKCGFRSEPGVAMKNECPNCKVTLKITEATAKELDYFLKTKLAQAPDMPNLEKAMKLDEYKSVIANKMSQEEE